MPDNLYTAASSPGTRLSSGAGAWSLGSLFTNAHARLPRGLASPRVGEAAVDGRSVTLDPG